MAGIKKKDKLKENVRFCVWKVCDQEPSYCEGHAHELVNPLQREFAPPALETNEHGVMEDKSQDADWLRARFFEQSIEIERLTELLALPYPPNNGKTHWEGCWKDRGHHNCAMKEIEQQAQQIAELEKEIEELQ